MKPETKYFKTWVEIDSKAIIHNFNVFQKVVGKKVAVAAVIKSNAYGHGLIEVANILVGSKPAPAFFCVDSLTEALTLRREGIKQPILILGYVPLPLLAEVVKHDLRIALYDAGVLKALSEYAKKLRKPARVHVKVETGTYRQGIMPDDYLKFIAALKKCEGQVYIEGMYSHFADTEDTSSTYYKTQLMRFEKALEAFERAGVEPDYIHISSSAGGFLYPEAHKSMARLGISLYGLYPSEDVKNHSTKILLKPALTWKTRIVQIKEIPRGETVGYNRTFTANQKLTVAILPVGYWDGVDRGFSNKGIALINGKKAPIIGRICMNICMVDISGVPNVKVGDEAVLLGNMGKTQVTAEEIAAIIGTINYEVVTRINPLIPRVVA